MLAAARSQSGPYFQIGIGLCAWSGLALNRGFCQKIGLQEIVDSLRGGGFRVGSARFFQCVISLPFGALALAIGLPAGSDCLVARGDGVVLGPTRADGRAATDHRTSCQGEEHGSKSAHQRLVTEGELP